MIILDTNVLSEIAKPDMDVRVRTWFGSQVATARANARSILIADGQIASIAETNGFTVATRDAAPFEAAGVPVINPWML